MSAPREPRLAHTVTLKSCGCGMTILFLDEEGRAWGEAHVNPEEMQAWVTGAIKARDFAGMETQGRA